MDETPQHSELEYRLRQQALLAALGQRALAVNDISALLDEAVRLAAIGLGAPYCKILEFEPENGRLRMRAGVGWPAELVGNVTVGADLDSPAGYALHTGKPVITNDLPHDTRFRTPQLLKNHGLSRAINVIVMRDGAPFGVLEADTGEAGAFSEHDVDFLQAIANLLGVAVDRINAAGALQILNQTLEERVAAEVSERRMTETVLRQAQKMEAIGRLTGGVAHDFNNLLMVISGGLQLLAKKLAHDPSAGELIGTIRKSAMRGQQLTSQLLAFARQQTLRTEPRNLNDLVREFDILASRILGETVELKMDLAPDIGECEIDAAQFGASLLNLIVNARDAIRDSGEVAIRTRMVVLGPEQAKALSADAKEGEYGSIEVEDNGSGMSEDVRQRVLEPFFTTKEPGRGTGLGLSQVYGFVRQSGGFLTIDSGPDRGTRIRLYFPCSTASAVRGESIEEETRAPGGAETVLVVEDDDAVRDIVVQFLENLGYGALVARSGPDALTLLQSTRADLVLTDMVMPGGMSGIDLAERLKSRDPPIPVVLASGYVRADAASEALGHDLPILWKPYHQEDLAKAVREALDRSPSAQRNGIPIS